MLGLSKKDRSVKPADKRKTVHRKEEKPRKKADFSTPVEKRVHARVAENPFAPKTVSDAQRAAFLQKRGEEIEIYVHIPFCLKKCLYCDFLSAPAESEKQVHMYMEDLRREIELVAADIREEVARAEDLKEKAAKIGKGKHASEKLLDAGISEYALILAKEIPQNGFRVRSIFFGGGTPTVVPAEELIEVLETIRENFTVMENAEITLEANPGTVTLESLKAYHNAGINRLSLGVQSANPAMLRNLGRIHTFEEARQAFFNAREAGFDNISIDLMSGLPHQTSEIWHDTLHRILELKPEHISAYGLMVEDGTPFAQMYRGDGERELPTEEAERQMYYDTERLLGEAGYVRYEISNYAKPGYECLHNLGYWTGVDYLGIGLGASSLWDRTRYQNVRDHKTYHAAIEKRDSNLLHTDIQKLGRNECMEEHMFLGLRCMKGISKKGFEEKFGVVYETVLGPATNRLLNKGLVETADDGDTIRLTRKGIDVSNQVFVEFLID